MRTAIFGGSFNAAGNHHLEIAASLMKTFDHVRVVLCGPRPDKPTVNDIEPVHRAAMADLTFRRLGPNVEVDLSDLELDRFTNTHDLDARCAGDGEIWHLFGADWIVGGRNNKSPIQLHWEHGQKLWENLNFIVAVRDGFEIDERDLPPNHIIFRDYRSGSSEEIRRRAANHQSLSGLVVPEVERYIERNNLYRGGAKPGEAKLKIDDPRPLFVVAEHRPDAHALAKRLRPLYGEKDPNMIVTLGGDGTLLHAVQQYWRLRLPFFPIHFGTYGFLLNHLSDDEIVSEGFFRQEFTTVMSPLLHLDVTCRDGSVHDCLAFNDAWVQVPMGTIGWFEVLINGKVRFPRLMGDGVLAATAAGSTAYARAMGAKPIHIGANGMVLAGSNIFNPTNWRNGANLPLHSLVEFRNADPSGYHTMFGFADEKKFGEVVSMKIRTSRIAAPEIAYLHYEEVEDRIMSAQFS